MNPVRRNGRPPAEFLNTNRREYEASGQGASYSKNFVCHHRSVHIGDRAEVLQVCPKAFDAVPNRTLVCHATGAFSRTETNWSPFPVQQQPCRRTPRDCRL